MAGEEARRSYPRIPASNWWTLRKRFTQTLPGRVDADYLQSVLGITAPSAKNLIPPLRTLGLIDEDGKPTDRGSDWRHDEDYARVCRDIIADIYPAGLTDTFPPSDDLDTDGVKRWFMRNAKQGEGSAGLMASFYALLARADSAEASERPAKKSPITSRVASRKADPNPRPATAATQTTVSPRVREADERQLLDALHADRGPAVHIDVQVHISADSSAEQIDQIFESMARHLYGRA
jgi:hypothetical protein